MIVRLFVAILLMFYGRTLSQDTISFSKRVPQNEVDIDVTSVLTFLKKDVQSYAIYYRHGVGCKIRLRSALNFSVSDDSDKGVYADFALGVDKEIVKEKAFKVYYGSDLFFSYSKGNFQPNRNYKLGAGLFIGATYFLTKQLSISTEPRLNFSYFIYRNPSSFDPAADKENYELGLGTIGLLLIGFHF
jgi:hypothetical protein